MRMDFKWNVLTYLVWVYLHHIFLTECVPLPTTKNNYCIYLWKYKMNLQMLLLILTWVILPLISSLENFDRTNISRFCFLLLGVRVEIHGIVTCSSLSGLPSICTHTHARTHARTHTHFYVHTYSNSKWAPTCITYAQPQKFDRTGVPWITVNSIYIN